MALKMGKTKEEIKELAQKKMELLGQGDITDKYTELMIGLTPEKFNIGSVDKKSAEENIQRLIDAAKDKVVEVSLNSLSDSPKNCYEKPAGEKREQLISSLKSLGQINPIFIRAKSSVESYRDEIENDFEILVGHSRVDCLREIGEEKVKAIIVECDDVQATLLIAQSNIQREKVSDIELARAYKNTYEAMKRDKNANLKNVEISTNLSKCQSGTSDRTDEMVAERYGISARTLHRKMALAYCTDEVISNYNKKKFNQEQIQSISKLNRDTQLMLCELMREEKLKMTNEKAKELLKVYNENEKNPVLRNSFPLNLLRKVMRDEEKKEDVKVEGKKQKESAGEKTYIISDNLFPKEVKKEDRQEWLLKALSYIKENEISIGEEYDA